MRVERFFEEFEKLAETPDSTPRLRALALDLAMRGRLLPQDPVDEPSWTTLQRTRTRPTRRSPAPDGAIAGAEGPYPLPASWCWVPLAAAMAKITDGTHHSPPNGPSGDFKYVTAKNIKNDGIRLDGITYVSRRVHEEIYARCDPRFGDVLYIKDGATTGIATINNLVEPFSMLSSVALLRPTGAVENRFLLWAMRSPFFYSETRNSMKGAAITRVTLAVLGSSLIPLPPLAEQKRIVAKVDELMALCDRLEAQQQERESRHAALARASLARFSEEPTPANLEFLFHKAYDIEPRGLRRSVLALATTGRLLAQVSSDEPASQVVARLAARGGNGQIRRSVPDAVPRPAAMPTETLPKSWVFESTARLLRVGALLDLKDGNHGANHPKVADFTSNGMPFITAAQVSDEGTIDYEGAYKVSGEPLRRLRVGFARPGDVVYTNKGSVGKVAICTRECVLTPQTTYYRPNPKILESEFLRWLLLSPLVRDQVDLVKEQTTRDFVAISTQYKLFLAIPPIDEQRRIVEKVARLMQLIDKLEARLAASRAAGEKLLEAVVAELTDGARAA